MKRLSLQVKLVVGLLVIASVPVAVSAFLIDRITDVAQSFASNEAARLRPSLQRAEGVYLELVETKKALYGTITAGLAERDDLLTLVSVASQAGLVELEIDDGTGQVKIPVTGLPEEVERTVVITHQIPDSGALLRAKFAVSGELTRDYKELGRVLAMSERVATVRNSLPSSYRTVFLLVIGAFALMLTAIGWFFGRRVTRRIDELVQATQSVAKGDMSVRAPVRGSDELTDVARAFNQMVEDLAEERRKRQYLQRIGTWQDVARKLAHEIKNPLTPIQLAVQQVQSSYSGEDEKHRKLLADCEEIVAEEIAGLRRLVDAFSALGRLPRVAAKPLDFAVVLDDLSKDPVFSASLTAEAPSQPIEVSADRLLLRRVMANLVENGMQAGETDGEPGPVIVTWFTSGKTAVAHVDDAGAGVPEGKTESIFEPYVTSKETGTGLGLAISKKICIEHGGNLELSTDRSPAGGARFVVTIPLA